MSNFHAYVMGRRHGLMSRARSFESCIDGWVFSTRYHRFDGVWGPWSCSGRVDYKVSRARGYTRAGVGPRHAL